METTAITTAADNQLQKTELSHSERFTRAVEKEFSGGVGDVQLTRFQRKLCQNYFIKIDLVLKDSEARRMAKKEKYREPIPFTWENVNLNKLAIDVITYSSVGLDPGQPNHINPIPYKNKANKYDFTFIIGYKGTELKSRKYGIAVPDDIIVELVYDTDTFKALKKDKDNPIETYEFKINNDFNRGEIIGGFYYHKYFSSPEKNKLRVFSRKDIEKRKPDYASVEFWGGKKDKWEWSEQEGKNVKVGTEDVEGWFDEMAWKTIYKAAWSVITIDSEKIDENYLRFLDKERDQKDVLVLDEIKEKGNKTMIGFSDEITSHEEVPPGTNTEHPPVTVPQSSNPEGSADQQEAKPPF